MGAVPVRRSRRQMMPLPGRPRLKMLRLPSIWSRKLLSLMAVVVTQTAPAMWQSLSPSTKQLLWSLLLLTS